jgi:hypothetical protein
MTDRQIITVLPTLSAEDVETLVSHSEHLDPQIARTILNAAINAAEPIPAATEYLNQYQTTRTDPQILRIVLNSSKFQRCYDPIKW